MKIPDWNTLQEWAKLVWQCELTRGFLFGLLFCLSLKIVFLIFRLMHRRKKCSEVRIDGVNGDIVISRRALNSAIAAEMAVFQQFERVEPAVYLERKGYRVKLSCALKRDAAKIPMQELKEKVTAMVTEKLAEIFNITGISEVELQIDDYTIEAPEFPEKEV